MSELRSPLDLASADRSGSHPVRRGADLRAGDVVGGKYVLLHPLAFGGMGQVWRARNSWTGAEVAMKALLPGLAFSGEAASRFLDEARATAKLAHRGIVRVFDLIELDRGSESPLIVMELLRGHSLTQRLKSRGPFSVEETLAIVQPLLCALSHAHGAGIIHRDVKPDNIFLARDPDGEVLPKLLDFGLSLDEGSDHTPPGRLAVGTRWYMAPEQARGEKVDARCDVFGVGLVLYECLTGVNPLRDAGTPRASRRIGLIPENLRSVIDRALAERPEDRFSSAYELAEALRAAEGGRRGPPLPPKARRARRHMLAPPALWALGVALAAALFAYACSAATVKPAVNGERNSSTTSYAPPCRSAVCFLFSGGGPEHE